MLRAAAITPDSDCEAIGTGLLAQPVNTITGLGFVVVAAILVGGLARRRLTRAALAIAALLLANAAGTYAYHGAPGGFSHWLHDTALVGLLAAIAGWQIGRLVDATNVQRPAGRGDAGTWIGALGGTVIAGVAVAVTHASTTPLAGAALGAIVVAEIVARGRRLPSALTNGLLALVAIAGASFALGRSGGPLCDPGSVLQLHGIWHLLIALVVLVWADRNLATAGPATGSGIGRQISDRLVGALAVVLVRAFHREVDVTGRAVLAGRGPVLFVVNHGNGFVDPLVVAAALRRLPRFIAKAALWKILPARLALDALAVLPVYRHADGDDPHGNERTFHATTRALRRGDRVAIFPEGTTGDRAGLDTVRSGAARIALGARRAGVGAITIIPVGLAFESRVATRSRVSVTFGPPIDLDTWSAGQDATDRDERALTHALTEEIRVALTAVSPVFATVDEREQLRMAAAVTLDSRSPARVGFGAVEQLASQIAAAPAPERHQVVDALAQHSLRREMVGVSDADLVPNPIRRGGVRLVVVAVALVAFGPLLAAVALIMLPAVVIVQGAVALVPDTATKGTVRMLVGLVTGALTWWIAAMIIANGTAAVAITMIGLGLASAVVLVLWEWILDGVSMLRMWFRTRDRAELVTGLVASRTALVAAVDQALEAANTTG